MRTRVVVQANVLVTGGEDANLLAWSCDPLLRDENEMTVDGASDPSILAKRDHDGDVEMGNLSPGNVCQPVPLSHHATPELTHRVG
jgi:hypothetical protein